MYLADPARAHAACAFHGRGGPAGSTHLHELQITEPGFKTGASDLFLLQFPSPRLPQGAGFVRGERPAHHSPPTSGLTSGLPRVGEGLLPSRSRRLAPSLDVAPVERDAGGHDCRVIPVRLWQLRLGEVHRRGDGFEAHALACGQERLVASYGSHLRTNPFQDGWLIGSSIAHRAAPCVVRFCATRRTPHDRRKNDAPSAPFLRCLVCYRNCYPNRCGGTR
jgi:hypothetical protein